MQHSLKGSLEYVLAHGSVWTNVKRQFQRQVVRPDIVRKMIECGMRVVEVPRKKDSRMKDLKIFVGNVEVDYSAVARAVDVDRRVVKQTVEQIRSNAYLYSIFSKTMPMGASLVDLVSVLGYSAIIVEADPRSSGVMAAVAEILSRHGMVVRQATADDPDMVPEAKLTLVVEGQVTGQAMAELNELKMVKSLKILK